jgi:sugar-specific transcriptional regulator TrmB
MMQEIFNQKTIMELLAKIGLTVSEIEVYLHLLSHGAKSIARFTRESDFTKTQLERILEKLLKVGLVNYRHVTKGQVFEASSVDHIEVLLKQKESEIELFKKSFPELIKSLSFLAHEEINMSKVVTYSGKEGFEQITRNTVNTQGIFRIFEVSYLAQESDFNFGEEIRRTFVKNNIQIHQLTNESVMPFDTAVKDILKPHYWQLRYISPSLLEMKYEMAIYNNVFCMYYFDKTDFFGVEIYNEKLAKVQRQIYDFMWESAQPMKYYPKIKKVLIN